MDNMQTRVFSSSGFSDGNGEKNNESITEEELDSFLMSEVDDKKKNNKKWTRTRKGTGKDNRINVT